MMDMIEAEMLIIILCVIVVCGLGNIPEAMSSKK